MSNENNENERDSEGKKKLVVEHLHKIISGKSKKQGENLGVSDAVLDEEYEGMSREELAEQLATREQQLGAIAMREFEKEKKQLVDKVRKDLGDEKADLIAEKITKPQALEDVRDWLGVFMKSKFDEDEGKISSKGSDSVPLDPRYYKEGVIEGVTTPTKSGIKGMSVKQIYDRYEKLLFKKETGKGEPMSDDELKEFQKLEDTINTLWYKFMKPAILEKRPAYRMQARKTTLCPKCESVIAERICPFCGTVTMSEKEWLARR